jgi:hypothetical protein
MNRNTESVSISIESMMPPETWFPLPEYRMVACIEVPEQKLQRCWREQRTGKCEWRTVETVFLTNHEYHQGRLPSHD